jgi:hypothetical protein
MTDDRQNACTKGRRANVFAVLCDIYPFRLPSCASLCRPHATRAILGKPFTRIKTNNRSTDATSGLRRETFGSAPRLRIRIQGDARSPEQRSREIINLTACRICRTLCRTPLSIVLFPSEIPPSTAEHRSGMDGAICIRERDRPLPPTTVCRVGCKFIRFRGDRAKVAIGSTSTFCL